MNREELFIKDICIRISKSKSVLYVLESGEEIIGLVALSASSVTDQPSVQIDYILLVDLSEAKILKYLIILNHSDI